MQHTAYKNYLLFILMVIMAFNYADRVAMGIVLEDVKTDLNLSDTQLGFLTGIAFAFFFAVMGIPIGRWVDRGNRVSIMTVIVALWSAGVALCGAAASFTQLLLARIGVAVGEGGGHPAALSLISDHFNREERPRATARYMLGSPLALTIGYIVAGWLNEFYGWRMTFVMLGLPGLLLAVLVAWTLKEPRRRKMAKRTPTETAPSLNARQPTVNEVLVTLWSSSAYRHLLFCFSVWGFLGYGVFQWQPAFFIRSHGLDTGELGTWLTVALGGGTLLGTVLGAELFARYAISNERLQFKVMAVLFLVSAVFMAGTYLTPDYYVAFGLLGIASVGHGAVNGPIFAATQTLVPPRMRAMSVALILFFTNLLGMGFGPLTVGALSDALRPMFGEESLRYTLVAFCPGYLWCAWHLWQGSRTANDIAAAHALDAEDVRTIGVEVAGAERQS